MYSTYETSRNKQFCKMTKWGSAHCCVTVFVLQTSLLRALQSTVSNSDRLFLRYSEAFVGGMYPSFPYRYYYNGPSNSFLKENDQELECQAYIIFFYISTPIFWDISYIVVSLNNWCWTIQYYLVPIYAS